jgi:Tol biopolymer transport system component
MGRRVKRYGIWITSLLTLVVAAMVIYRILRPPLEGRFVFSYDGRICVGNASGGLRRCLAEGQDPSWSPDGQQIAFGVITLPNAESGTHRIHSIYIINANSAEPTLLTELPGIDPTWSPDGKQIAFSSTQIYVIDTDGSNLQPLTSDDAEKYEPAWSPDGQQIAFMARPQQDEKLDIYVMNADGSNIRRLTYDEAHDTRPAWSPDGQRIAFDSYRDGNSEIYVMNADGSGQTRLTNHPKSDRGPVWSPDGREIAFSSGRGGRTGRILYEGVTVQLFDIYLMNADGSNVRRLTYSLSGSFEDLDWSSGSGISR